MVYLKCHQRVFFSPETGLHPSLFKLLMPKGIATRCHVQGDFRDELTAWLYLALALSVSKTNGLRRNARKYLPDCASNLGDRSFLANILLAAPAECPKWKMTQPSDSDWAVIIQSYYPSGFILVSRGCIALQNNIILMTGRGGGRSPWIAKYCLFTYLRILHCTGYSSLQK